MLTLEQVMQMSSIYNSSTANPVLCATKEICVCRSVVVSKCGHCPDWSTLKTYVNMSAVQRCENSHPEHRSYANLIPSS